MLASQLVAKSILLGALTVSLKGMIMIFLYSMMQKANLIEYNIIRCSWCSCYVTRLLKMFFYFLYFALPIEALKY